MNILVLVQMETITHCLFVSILNIIKITTSSQISFFVEIELVVRSNQSPHPDIEFSIVIKQWFFNVLLNDILSIDLFIIQILLDVFDLL